MHDLCGISPHFQLMFDQKFPIFPVNKLLIWYDCSLNSPIILGVIYCFAALQLTVNTEERGASPPSIQTEVTSYLGLGRGAHFV